LRDYIHVCDLIGAHICALEKLRGSAKSMTVNCGYGHGFSVFDVIKTVKKVSKTDFKVELSPRRAGDPAAIVASCETAKTMLGWQPEFDDLKTIVKHAYKWEAKLMKRAGK
jgi:UDP-glucose 4-epimerase